MWEFLDNEAVIRLVKPYFADDDCGGAALKLINESVRCWTAEEDVVDDITCVVVFFKPRD